MEIKERTRALARRMRPVGVFLKKSLQEWSQDKALRHAAALAYYTVFAMAPVLVIAIAVAGFFFGEQAVQGEIVTQLQDFIGPEAAVFVENMLREVQVTNAGVWPTVLSLGTVLFGAFVIFAAVQDVLNMIWGVKPAPEAGVLYTIRRRLLAFVLILCFGAAMVGALLISAGLTIAEAFWEDWFGTELDVWMFSDQAVWLVFFTVMFGIIYKLLPDVEMSWRDVWLGAFMTAVLFGVGLFGISMYIGIAGVGTVFGAAGTLAVILVWVYYSWVIVLVGAEMTQVWARRFGHGIRAGKNAVLRQRVSDETKSRVGKGPEAEGRRRADVVDTTRAKAEQMGAAEAEIVEVDQESSEDSPPEKR